LATITALVNIKATGISLIQGESIELPALSCLIRHGDSNLEISYNESDREELMQLDTANFELLSRVLNSDITTHEELCALLLPPKRKAMKPLLKSKPSSLTE
jgi:hypothetical protein